MAKGIYIGVSPNLIVNGDFSDGLKGWTLSNNGTTGEYSVIEENGEKVLRVVATGRSPGIFQRPIPNLVLNTHIYYLSLEEKFADVSDGSNNIQITLGISTNNAAETNYANQWYRLSRRYTPSANENNNSFSILINNYPDYAAGAIMWLKNIKLYDLTELYGAGNEPAQEWCDNNLSALESKSKARKVKKACIGVGGVARKIKKGYIGVGGVARLFYSAETLIPFTSNPAPTTGWTYSSLTKDSATNDYGTWTVESQGTYSQGHEVAKAFDNDDYSNWLSESLPDYTTTSYIQLNAPSGVLINPKQFYIYGSCLGGGIISGLNEKGVWENLVINIEGMRNNSFNSVTCDVSTNNYYSAIRFTANRSPILSVAFMYVRTFKIVSGTLKIE